jgi:hypothetical protein
MEAALDARRLKLVVSMEDATVLSTSSSPEALFGFDPQDLVSIHEWNNSAVPTFSQGMLCCKECVLVAARKQRREKQFHDDGSEYGFNILRAGWQLFGFCH